MYNRFLVIVLVVLGMAVSYLLFTQYKMNDYQKKAERYQELADSLSDVTANINARVRLIDTSYYKRITALNEAINIINEKRAINSRKLDSIVEVQMDEQAKFCEKMAQLGETGIHDCKNK